MPTGPGVYRMLGADGEVLYVGKAKNLTKRVTSYTHGRRLTYRLQRMVAQTVAMEIVTTETEAEALLLEANLIKRLKPKYNILLRDDKTFPYILLTDHVFPRITKHRGSKKQKGAYFGPFASAGDVNETIENLQKIFLLRPCSDSYFASRKRPCLEYQIKRCSAPCVGKISEDDYQHLVDQARAFLSGKSREIQKQLVVEMQQASDEMDYEHAAQIRDRIQALNHIQAKQAINLPSLKDTDVIGLSREDEHCCVQVFFFRAGQNFGNKAYFPIHTADMTDEEILNGFIGQFYQTHFPPGMILTSTKVQGTKAVEEALSSVVNHKVHINVPKQGDKFKVVSTAVQNAKEALLRKVGKLAHQQGQLEKLADLLQLPEVPKRIEVYDNSHISGKHATGAMIVAGEEGFIKNAYRRYNVTSTSLTGGDDYGMLKEVLQRRFTTLQKCPEDKPDIMLIDGGKGHLSVASKVFEEFAVTDIMLVCIAKGPQRNAGREQFFMVGKEPFQLEPNDPVLYYLQILRDEAHRFAIGTHRKKRADAIKGSSLDAIPNIGAIRKKALLHHFGSAKAVEQASVEDIAKVEGISRPLAQKIYDHLH